MFINFTGAIPSNLPIPKKSKYKNCVYEDTIYVCGGIINVSKTIKKIIFLPLNSNLAKPYPASVQNRVCKIILVNETPNVNVRLLQ